MSVRGAGSVRYVWFLLPLLAAAVVATAPPQRAQQQTALAIVSVTSAVPAAIRLVPGGDAVKATVQGRNLDRRDLRGEALLSGRVDRGVRVSLDRPSANGSRGVVLCASPNALPGTYTVRLTGKGAAVALAIRVDVEAARSAGVARARPGGAGLSACGIRESARRVPPARLAPGAARISSQAVHRVLAPRAAGRLFQLGPGLKFQTGTGEFEGYATTAGIGEPMVLFFQWTRAHSEASSAAWEVRRGATIVQRGSAGAAPAVGQAKIFQIDFRTFLPAPAPTAPVKYTVRLYETKLVAQAAAQSPAVPVVPDYLIPASNAVGITYAKQSDTVFTDEGIPEEDRDHDGFTDATENALADEFRPYFIFDAEESDRRPSEPVVIFQAQCLAGGPSCTHAQIKYYYLFQRDGGWQSCSPWCGNAHNGDNQSQDIEVYKHLAEKSNPYTYWWSNWGGEVYQWTHPVLYLSAGKHHNYYSTDRNHELDGACCDDVAGDGDQVFPSLLTGNVYNNVGERRYHLIDALDFLGFPGECAWCDKPFRGGLPDDHGDSTAFEWW
jgi:hypothetical protein